MSKCTQCGGKLIEVESMRHTIKGGREGDTTYRYYTCENCGAKRTNYTDHGGFGGRDSFWKDGHIDDSGKEVTG